MDLVTDDDGNLFWLQCIPGDGNCLFGALVHQIFGITPDQPLFSTYSLQLREAVVREIRGRLWLYFDHVSSFAEELYQDDTPAALKVERYLEALQFDGFWGGAESLAAVCNFLQVSITVYQDNGKIEFTPTVSELHSWPVCNIYYRGILGQARTHYDSVVCIRFPIFFSNLIVSLRFERVQLFNTTILAHVLRFDESVPSLFTSIHHQLTGSLPTSEELNIYRCLVARDIERRPVSFLTACGFTINTEEDKFSFAFRLRIGRIDGGLASLVSLTSLMQITIYLHSTVLESRRFDPSDHVGRVTIHVMEEVQDAHVTYSSVTPQRLARRTSCSKRQNCLMEPLDIAGNVIRKELTDTQETFHPIIEVQHKDGLRLASLNVNGCRAEQKRHTVDGCLISHHVHLALLQEVNIDCLQAVTSNYRWLMGSKASTRKRGLAILFQHGLDVRIKQDYKCGPNIQCLELTYQVIIKPSLLNIF